MARPRTELGTWGKITTVGQVEKDGSWVTASDGEKPERHRARTKIRDLDGKLRDVERYGPTKTKAEATLKAALRDRVAPKQGDVMRIDMAVVKAGELWLEQVDRPDSGRTAGTAKQYRRNFGRYLEGSSIAELTLAEVNSVPIVRTFLQGVADNHGTGAAKTARSVLSGILTMAVDDGVLEVNAARQVRPAKAKEPRKTKHQIRRSLKAAERDELLAAVEADEASQRRDLVDVVRFMLGTGVRIAEALAVEWPDLDFDAGTVHVRGTKSEAADRELDLPDWLLDALEARYKEQGLTSSLLVFPSLRDTLRDSVNVMHQLRDVLDRSGFEWVTSHTFRRTAATRLHDAGVPIVRAADQLGHADPSMTLRNYIGRRGDTSGNAQHL